MNAAALMTADQYRANAEKMIAECDGQNRRDAEIFAQLAQVYALLAISANEHSEDVP